LRTSNALGGANLELKRTCVAGLFPNEAHLLRWSAGWWLKPVINGKPEKPASPWKTQSSPLLVMIEFSEKCLPHDGFRLHPGRRMLRLASTKHNIPEW